VAPNGVRVFLYINNFCLCSGWSEESLLYIHFDMCDGLKIVYVAWKSTKKRVSNGRGWVCARVSCHHIGQPNQVRVISSQLSGCAHFPYNRIRQPYTVNEISSHL
jgi:hypothetical protein